MAGYLAFLRAARATFQAYVITGGSVDLRKDLSNKFVPSKWTTGIDFKELAKFEVKPVSSSPSPVMNTRLLPAPEPRKKRSFLKTIQSQLPTISFPHINIGSRRESRTPSSNGASSSVSVDVVRSELFSITFGGQHKSCISLRLVADNLSDALSFTTSLPSLPQTKAKSGVTYDYGATPECDQGDVGLDYSVALRVNTALFRYSETITALVLFIPSESRSVRLPGNTDVCSEVWWCRYCRNVMWSCVPWLSDLTYDGNIDMHFDEIHAQYASALSRSTSDVTVRLDTPGHSVTVKALPRGSCLVTKHGNLRDVHAIFNVMVDNVPRSKPMSSDNGVNAGLSQVLETSANSGVSTLTVPLLIHADITSNELSSNLDAYCKRAENTCRLLRGELYRVFFNKPASLSLIQLSIPRCSPDAFDAIRDVVSNIFKTQ